MVLGKADRRLRRAGRRGTMSVQPSHGMSQLAMVDVILLLSVHDQKGRMSSTKDPQLSSSSSSLSHLWVIVFASSKNCGHGCTPLQASCPAPRTEQSHQLQKGAGRDDVRGQQNTKTIQTLLDSVAILHRAVLFIYCSSRGRRVVPCTSDVVLCT